MVHTSQLNSGVIFSYNKVVLDRLYVRVRVLDHLGKKQTNLDFVECVNVPWGVITKLMVMFSSDPLGRRAVQTAHVVQG